MTDMLVREEYGMEFLKGKGFFSEVLDMTDGDVGYRYDPEHKLAYFEYETDDDIRRILNLIKPIRDYEYYWFWRDGRLRAYQVFGENKWFTYNLEHSGISEYKKSKQDKLKKFNPKNVNMLFDVKDVIKTFYRNLWHIRISMAQSIRNDISDQEKILAAQRMIDRLIFVYFIGQNRILKMIDDRGKNTEYYIKELFEFILNETYKGDSIKFYRFLNRLFFLYLNSERNDDLRIEGAHGYSLKVPFLNGGLFREHEIVGENGTTIKESDLDIAYNWGDLISELNRYNWMLGEYLPTEKGEIIGNLTPEILGHIYEKFVITISGLDEIKIDELKFTKEGELKRGNKKIGAYYTPEVITRYIAENTIFPCIRDKLGIEEKYGTFGMFFEDNGGNSDLLAKVGGGLKDVTILDPAVGSGAFLMAAGDLLVEWREKCGDKTDKYEVKKEIIVNNLYGVDIMDGAVDICKLRLWLWLISGTGEKIEPLPNIEYNIRCGNSLIGYVDAPTGEQLSLSFMEVAEPVQRTLVEPETRQMEFVRETVKDILKKKGAAIKRYKVTSHAGDAERLRGKIEGIDSRFRPQLDDKLFLGFYKDVNMDFDGLKEFVRELKPFHWGFEFYDVFDPELPEEERGFDVVVGNPPYVRQERIGRLKPYFQNQFVTYHGVSDLYVYFIEEGVSLLKSGGVFGIIVANKWMRANYGKPLRQWLKQQRIEGIIDFGNLPVFEGTTIYPCILRLGKKDARSTFSATKMETMNFTDLSAYVAGRQYTVDQTTLGDGGWSLADRETETLLNKVRDAGVALGEYVDGKIYYGIKTGLNDAFIIDSKTKSRLIEEDSRSVELIKPLLIGKDIKRYKITENSRFIIFTRHGTDISQYPAIQNYLVQFKDRLMPKPKDWGGEMWNGRKAGSYEWYEIQDSIDYCSGFEKPKIIWGNLCIEPPFAFDESGYYVNAPACILISDEFYLLGLLNSTLLWYFLKQIAACRAGGFIEAKPIYVKQLPIHIIDSSDPAAVERHDQIEDSVARMLDLHKRLAAAEMPDETTALQQQIDATGEQIDQVVYELYGLTEGEIKVVEGSVK